MVLEALMALLVLVIVFGLSIAFIPLVIASIGAMGSLIAGVTSRVSDYISDLRSERREKSRVISKPTAQSE